jgi:hypothetical protein
MQEQWLECMPGYEVSNTGKIRSNNGPMRTWTQNGYEKVSILGRSYRVHRLVAIAFLPNDNPNRTCIDHIDGNKLNNDASNLRWVTDSENMYAFYERRRAMGLTKRRKVMLRIYDKEGECLEFPTINSAAVAFDLDASSMWSYSLTGKFWDYTVERIVTQE